MHGRIKTITSEEQKKRQEHIRRQKVEAYRSQITQIWAIRKMKLLDESALKIIEDVLLTNPDILSLWNIRREILCLNNLNHGEPEGILKNELALTQQCLLVNQKSYCAWHHRLWCLEKLPSPWLCKELAICNVYLTKDERNFHCWNYRAIVAESAKISHSEELKFTQEKLEANFSNYSAWHYRSKLLPKVYPDYKSELSLSNDQLEEELGTVHSAVYTDPNDQSPWFYQRWLLMQASPDLFIVGAQMCEDKITLAVSRSVNLNDDLSLFSEFGNSDSEWSSFASASYATIWQRDCTKAPPAAVMSNADTTISAGKPYYRRYRAANLSNEMSALLTKELQEMQQLLEIEPDNKWILLAVVNLMVSLNITLYFQEIISLLTKVKNIDPMRSNRYDDMMSKVIMENKLLNQMQPLIFDLSGSNLTCLYHTQYLMFTKVFNLRDNKLRSCDLKNLYPLVSCEELDLSSNLITTFEFFPLKSFRKLKVLCISNNCLIDASTDVQYLRSALTNTDIKD